MTRKIKTTLLTGLLFFGLLTGLQAQEILNNSYEYAIVDADVVGLSARGAITFSVAGKTYEEVKTKGQCKNYGEYTCVLDFLKVKLDGGWEIVSTHFAEAHIYYFLKKKK